MPGSTPSTSCAASRCSAQLAIVLGVWAVQLVASPLWLRRYRFGPAEWVWRSLTYGERPPFRRVAAPAP